MDDRTLLLASTGALEGGTDGSPEGPEGRVPDGGADPDGGVLDAASDGAEAAPPDAPLSFDAGPCVHESLDGSLDCDDTVVLNADFNINTAGWKADVFADGEWSQEDVQDAARSGSLLVRNRRTGDFDGAVSQGVSQCLVVEVGTIYSFLAESFIPRGQSEGSADIAVWFHASDDCSGLVDRAYTVATSTTVGEWVITTGTGLRVPSTARSMAVRLNARKQWREESFHVLYDAVRVRAN